MKSKYKIKRQAKDLLEEYKFFLDDSLEDGDTIDEMAKILGMRSIEFAIEHCGGETKEEEFNKILYLLAIKKELIKL